MAVVLPQGRFNNSSDKYIREFYCGALPHPCRRWLTWQCVQTPHRNQDLRSICSEMDDELCQKKEDYPIFFATMQKPSKDNSGEKIYVKDPITGENVLDRHGHLIVDHDLYSHDGLTRTALQKHLLSLLRRKV